MKYFVKTYGCMNSINYTAGYQRWAKYAFHYHQSHPPTSVSQFVFMLNFHGTVYMECPKSAHKSFNFSVTGCMFQTLKKKGRGSFANTSEITEVDSFFLCDFCDLGN